MPSPAIRSFVIFTLIPMILCTCSTVQPQGALKAVIRDESSESAPRTPAEQKKIEDNLRLSNRQTPIPKEKKGAMGIKIPF